jgi:hypothetical protein
LNSLSLETPKVLLDGKSPGQPSKLNDAQRQAVARMIKSGPIPVVHGVVHWRLIDLAQWIFDEFRITIAKQTLSRELRAMGYRELSARPRHHAQAVGAIEHAVRRRRSPCLCSPGRMTSSRTVRQASALASHAFDRQQHLRPSARTPRTTSSETQVALASQPNPTPHQCITPRSPAIHSLSGE